MLAGYRNGPWLQENEAFCRISLDAMLRQSSEQLMTEGVMPQNATLCHEQSTSVDLQGLRICGRADYALGHDGDLNRKDCGALLAARSLIRNIVLERKPTAPRISCNDEVPSVWFRQIQLLCPGLLHGRNSLPLCPDKRRWPSSRVSPNPLSKTGLAKIFNFVCDLLGSSILSTPTLTKRHPFPHLSTQIEKYESETWRAAFAIDELCEEYGIWKRIPSPNPESLQASSSASLDGNLSIRNVANQTK